MPPKFFFIYLPIFFGSRLENQYNKKMDNASDAKSHFSTWSQKQRNQNC